MGAADWESAVGGTFAMVLAAKGRRAAVLVNRALEELHVQLPGVREGLRGVNPVVGPRSVAIVTEAPLEAPRGGTVRSDATPS